MMHYGPIRAPDLAADLEYMLQSHHVEDYLVAEELLRGYYAAVKSLVEASLDEKSPRRSFVDSRFRKLRSVIDRQLYIEQDPRESQREIELKIEQVFMRAVANRYTYQPGEKVGVWLFAEARKSLGLPQDRTTNEEFSSGQVMAQGDEKRDWNDLAGKIARQVKKFRRGIWSVKRVALASLTLGMSLALVWVFRLINPPEAPVKVKQALITAPVLATAPADETAIEAVQISDTSRILVPERAPYDSVRLVARVHFPEWQSMASPWYQIQAWVGKDQLLALGGPDGDAPMEGILIKDGLLYRSHEVDGKLIFVQQRGLQGFPINRFLYATLDLLLNGEKDSELADVHGRDEMGGRDSWSVKLTNQFTGRQVQVWLDEQTGFIMRYRLLGSSSNVDSLGLPDEVQVKSVDFNVSFPQELFNPEQVRDSWGQ